MPTYRYLISACLCGYPCRYDGQSRPKAALVQLVKEGLALPFCPETAGGLPTPRTPCERKGQLIMDQNGCDRTASYQAGAQQALALAQKHRLTAAILKERSPSCGSRQIYDGTFTGTLIDGMGLTAQLLAENGLALYSEENLPPEISSPME